MNNRKFKAVIFDLDNVLYPGDEYILSGCKAVAGYLKRIYGIDLLREIIAQYKKNENNFISEALNNHFNNVEPMVARRAQEVFRCHFPKLNLYPDARTGLAVLTAAHVKKALVADGCGYVQRRKVEALGVMPLIDSVVFSDDLGGKECWKPAPDPFFIMSLQLDCDTSGMIFVGADPEKDFIAPRQLDMGTVRVVHNKKTNCAVDNDAHITIPSLEHILHAVETLEKTMPPAREENSWPIHS